jgi:hypothetical protein
LYRGFQVSQGTQGLVAHVFTIAVLKRGEVWGRVHAYALCPMPYALCPMPARAPNVTEKGYTNQFYWGCAIELNRKLKLITNSPFP